jgi:Raf kinase inhibitor-like YbhB/YbcL family protein
MKRQLLIPMLSAVMILAMGSCAPAPAATQAPTLTVEEAAPAATQAPSPTEEEAAPAATQLPSPTAEEAAAEDLQAPSPTAKEAAPVEQGDFVLCCSSFNQDQPIPVRHTCHGEDLSPPLSWDNPPPGTQSFTLLMDDPDAVEVAGFVWDHWLLFNIPPEARSLPEGLPTDAHLSDGSRHGKNSFSELGYRGPCPPSGQTHRYVFRLYALDTLLDLDSGASKDQILEAMDEHVLARAQLDGLYTSP